MSRFGFVFALSCTLVVIVGQASARTMLVRVGATSYQELSERIEFKGTSIEIAGARPGRSYDLLLDEADLFRIDQSGLEAEVITPDLDGWKQLVARDGRYQSYDELTEVLRGFAANRPDICVLESIGPSYEGRWIYGLKISDNPAVEENETEVLFFGQIHSREWAAGQVC
ncbi:MAG: M14 family zinc carboxypeptidase, partial [candidate division WOR-3 bacterium]